MESVDSDSLSHREVLKTVLMSLGKKESETDTIIDEEVLRHGAQASSSDDTAVLDLKKNQLMGEIPAATGQLSHYISANHT